MAYREVRIGKRKRRKARNSREEALCPPYLIRTDDTDYRVRPMDMKHPVILPIGHEVDRMMAKIPDGDQKCVLTR